MKAPSGIKAWAYRAVADQRLSVLAFHALPQHAQALKPNELTLGEFETLLRELRRFLVFLPLDEAVMRLQAGTLPRGAACITLDDGYPSWRTGVVPVLEGLDLHATFFVTTGQLSGARLWNERLRHLIDAAPLTLAALQIPPDPGGHAAKAVVEVAGLWPLSSPAQRVRAYAELEERLKRANPTERERALASLEAQTGVERDELSGFTEQDVRDIHARGFGIGAHTVSHPILSSVPLEVGLREMSQSRETLEGLIGAPVRGFAYPNGRPGQDFHYAHVQAAQRCGFAYAVTTGWGVARSGDDLFQIPRFTPWGTGGTRPFLQMLRNLRTASTLAASTGEKAAPPVQRALMVAYHFPPQTGSSGMLRTLNFAKYLPKHGWQTTVLTAHLRAYEKLASDLVRDIPPGCRVLRAPAWDTARHMSWRGRYLSLMALPDRWWSWWPFAVWRGLRFVRQEAAQGRAPQLIWSTYPIASAHLVGATLARLTGLPWVADFRDPMVSGNYPEPGLRRRLWQAVEGYTLRHATRCVFTTASAAAMYAQRYPQSTGQLRVVENGYDEEVFARTAPHRTGVGSDTLLLLHSGIIYPKDRDPRAFFKAVAALIERGSMVRGKVCVRFRATGHDAYVREIAQSCGVADVLDIAPPIPYQEAIGEMMGADLLLLFQGSHFNAQIPAKVYEYLRAGRPVLGLVDTAGQTARVLAEYGASACASIDDEDDIARALTSWLQVRKTQVFQAQLAVDQGLAKSNSRESLTALLALELQQTAPCNPRFGQSA